MQPQTHPIVLVFCIALLCAACSPSSSSDTPPSNTPTPSGHGHGSGNKTDLTEEHRAFLQDYEAVRTEATDMTPESFLQRYAPAPTIADLPYDTSNAAHLSSIATTFPIAPEQQQLLDQNGFVVLDNAQRGTPEEAYADIYFNDLPVLITTDSILYALHRSFDRILKTLEETVLVSEIQTMLSKMHTQLASLHQANSLPSSLSDAVQDTDIYLAVAQTLLTGQTTPTVTGPQAQDRASKILQDAETLQPSALTLFGVQSNYDYSQLKPRGHYEDSEVLQRYFKAMMWIGRTELPMVTFDTQGQPIFQRQALDSAFLMNTLLAESHAQDNWNRVNLVLEKMIGERDSMDPRDMKAFQVDHNLDSLQTYADTSDNTLQDLLLSSPYGIQRIMSQIIFTDPHDPEVVLPRVYLLLGQRFVIDSYVFHNVTYDRLKDVKTGNKITRMLPSPLDIQFALGSNAAADLLRDEIDTYKYQGTLHEVRHLVESHPEEFWSSNLYNGWLDAIRALNDSSDREALPDAMKTRAWDHKTLNTQLASWSELRHDTILYAKQSYSGGVGCEYPAAYVEPHREFFKRMARLGAMGEDMAGTLSEQGFDTASVKDYFSNLSGVMSTLEGIVVKELAQDPLSSEEWDFLRATIEREMVGCGETRYDGWYGTLFFSEEDMGDFAPTIADVHTAPTDAAGNPVGWVLHGATGTTKLMVFTIETCEGPQAYIGPVSTYYEALGENFKRYTKNEWTEMVYSQNPPRPSWTSSFTR